MTIHTTIPSSSLAMIRRARERSLRVHGAKLFNLLPHNLRNKNSGDFALFKNHLDIFLSSVPDQLLLKRPCDVALMFKYRLIDIINELRSYLQFVIVVSKQDFKF